MLRLPGSNVSAAIAVCCSASFSATEPVRTSYALRRASSRATPSPPVALDCGSQSISSVGRPSSASAAAKLIAVVVLPTPPFWLTTAMTLDVATAAAAAAATSVGPEAIFDSDWRSGTVQQEAYRAMGCRGKPHACAEAAPPCGEPVDGGWMLRRHRGFGGGPCGNLC